MPDAPDADDLAGGIDERETVEQVAAVFRQRVAICREDRVLERELVTEQANPQRWILGDPEPPCHRLGELPRSTGARAPPRLPVDVLPNLFLLRRLEESDQLVCGDQVVPDVELLRPRVVGHAQAVRTQAVRNGPLGDALLQPGFTGQDDDARDEA